MESINNILNTKLQVISALEIVRQIDLNDCWIGAGFIRNSIWDYLHDKETPITDSDLDVIFYDDKDTSLEYELYLETKLHDLDPNFPWSVKNQARMKSKYYHSYSTCVEAISFWPETATCIAAKLNNENEIEIISAYGYDDLLNLILRPSPKIAPSVFISRINEKDWLKKWPKLRVVM